MKVTFSKLALFELDEILGYICNEAHKERSRWKTGCGAWSRISVGIRKRPRKYKIDPAFVAFHSDDFLRHLLRND